MQRRSRRDVEDVEDDHEDELYAEGEKAVHRIGDGHREAREVDLAVQARVAVKGVLALEQRAREEGPEHRAREVEQRLGDAVGPHLGDAPEDKHVHNRGYQGLEQEP